MLRIDLYYPKQFNHLWNLDANKCNVSTQEMLA